MATRRVQIGSDATLFFNAEHCIVDDETLRVIGTEVGEQVRIRTDSGELALFTIVERFPPGSFGRVQVGFAGIARIGSSAIFFGNATIDSLVVRHDLTDAEAEAQSEFVERLRDDPRNRIIAIAPHGGDIEGRTDAQAIYMASWLGRASYWVCKGWKSGGGARQRWHITASDINVESFPLLRSVFGRHSGLFDSAVAFHGYTGRDVLIGGGAPITTLRRIKDEIIDALRITNPGIGVRVALSIDRFDGDSSANIVNRLSANGVQIEQPEAVRRADNWFLIPQAVARVLE